MWLPSTFSLVSPCQSWHLGHTGSKHNPELQLTAWAGWAVHRLLHLAGGSVSYWLCWILSCSSVVRWLSLFDALSGAIFKHSSCLSSVNLVSIFSILLANLLIKMLKKRFLQNRTRYIFSLWCQPLKTNLWKCFFQAVVYRLIMVSAVLYKVETLLNSICIPAAATSYPLPIILQSRKLDWFDKINSCQIHLAV